MLLSVLLAYVTDAIGRPLRVVILSQLDLNIFNFNSNRIRICPNLSDLSRLVTVLQVCAAVSALDDERIKRAHDA